MLVVQIKIMNNDEDDEAASRYIELILHITRFTLEMIQQAGAILAPTERDQALHILSYALDLDEAWPLVRDMILAMAPKMELMGHRYDWMEYLKIAAQKSQEQGELDSRAEFHLQIALIYRLLNQLDQAWLWAIASASTFASIGHAHNLIRALAEQAWIEQEQKNYQAALLNIQKAFSLLDEYQLHDELIAGICYRVRGMIAIGLNNYSEAEIDGYNALASFQKHNDQRRVGWGLHNLGLVFSRQKQYQRAISYYSQAAPKLLAVNDKYHLAHARFNQGIAHAELEEWSKATTCYQEAAAIYIQLDDKFRLSRIQTDMGRAWLAQGKYHLALHAFQFSINLSLELGDESWRLNAVAGQVVAYLEQKEYAKAIEVLKQAMCDLPKIVGATNYDYLSSFFHEHMQKAITGLQLGTSEQA